MSLPCGCQHAPSHSLHRPATHSVEQGTQQEWDKCMVCFSLERNVKEPCMLRIIWQARGIKDCVHTMTRLSALLKKTNTATHKVFHPPITLYTIVKLNTIPSYPNSISTPPLFFSISHRLLCRIMNGISSDHINEDCVTGHLCQSQSLVTVSWP